MKYFDTPRILEIGLSKKVSQIACGEKHTLFLLEDRTAASMGFNMNGQLRLSTRQASSKSRIITTVNEVSLIAAGGNHSLVVCGMNQNKNSPCYFIFTQIAYRINYILCISQKCDCRRRDYHIII